MMKTMKKRSRYGLLMLASVVQSFVSFSQPTTGYSGTGANIDVKYHRCEWTINPDAARNIAGTVTTYFVTTQPGVKKITFDLSGNLNFSASYHGSSIATGRPSANVIELALPVTLPMNQLDSVTISYSGTPPNFGDYGEGFERKAITGMGNVVYTLAESYGDDDWWPCKADMQDKIDSMDFIITTPSAFRAATNGLLVSDIISGTNRIMSYKHRYPIASYLVAIGVAKYNVFDRGTVNINGTDVPIVYYIYSGRGTNPSTQLNAMDFCKQELVAFSSKYGDYPFKNEKYGMYEFGWGGGMEHQTFSAMGWSAMSSWSVIAHELAHQWFGDKVTFATWNHLWLAEGFAKYSEVLAAELVSGLGQSPISHRNSIKTTAMSTSTTPVYLSAASIANSNTIWTTANDNAIYQRGAMVVSMLRKLAGDAKFFQALKNYLNDPALAYRSATTEDLKNHFEAVLDYDLDPFFEDYIYGTGNPAYDISWGYTGNRINIELTTQRKSTGSTVSYFHTPVVLKIYNAGKTKDTTVVIYDQNGQLSYAGRGIQATRTGKVLGYLLSFTPASVEVDPDSETLVRASNTSLDATANRSTVAGPLASLATSSVILLPINILDFHGIANAEGNLLSLALSSTSENISITLERSENGRYFYSLGAMEKIGSTTSGLKYQFPDKNLSSAPVYYYRAKTMDDVGVIKYSKVVRIAGRMDKGGFLLSPNPASDYFHLNLAAAWQSTVRSYIIYDSGGAVVAKEKISNAGSQLRVSVRHLPAGSYRIELTDNGGKQLVRSFIVSR